MSKHDVPSHLQSGFDGFHDALQEPFHVAPHRNRCMSDGHKSCKRLFRNQRTSQTK